MNKKKEINKNYVVEKRKEGVREFRSSDTYIFKVDNGKGTKYQRSPYHI